MNLDRFLRERQGAWTELEGLCNLCGRRPQRLAPAEVRSLGALYRTASADLAQARRRFPGDPVVDRLEALVKRSWSLVYGTPTRRGSIVRFFAVDYWRFVWERRIPLALAASLLFGSALLAGGWALSDPGAAAGLVPSNYAAVVNPRPHGANLGLTGDEKAAVSSAIFTNNIRVGFAAFAGGILLGFGAAALLIFNGILLGVVAGLSIGAGNGNVFFQLVTAHGVLELSCIVVVGAAGMRLGWAIVEPGRATRTESLRREAVRSVAIVLGTAPWLVVAGLVEGFVTPSGFGLAAVVALGFALGALYWTLVTLLGRGTRDAPEPLPADTR